MNAKRPFDVGPMVVAGPGPRDATDASADHARANVCADDAKADETTADRRARLESMDPDKREQLSQNYERFLHLDPRDRERLRQLDAALEAAPDRDELRQVMQHYHEWLNELPASQRMMLSALPAEDRLKRVEEIRGFQGHQRHKLSPQDVEAVSDWARKQDIQRKWFESQPQWLCGSRRHGRGFG